MQPLPVLIPVRDIDTNIERDAVSNRQENMILINERDDLSLGRIVFNGALLKTHSMAGCFMAVTPDEDGYLNMPDNLKVI